jgi:hypothetical protein
MTDRCNECGWRGDREDFIEAPHPFGPAGTTVYGCPSCREVIISEPPGASVASPCLNCGDPIEQPFCGTCREMGCHPRTGPLQFSKDWPGVFIRGDDALAYARVLRGAYEFAEKRAREDAGWASDPELWTRLKEIQELLESCRSSYSVTSSKECK